MVNPLAQDPNQEMLPCLLNLNPVLIWLSGLWGLGGGKERKTGTKSQKSEIKKLKDLVHLQVTLKLPILVVYYCT